MQPRRAHDIDSGIHRISVVETVKTDLVMGLSHAQDHAAIAARISPQARVVALDMQGIRLMDFAWPSHVIGELYREHPNTCFYLDFTKNPDRDAEGDATRVNISAAMFQWRLCILASMPGRRLQILGKAPADTALEVLAAIQRQRAATVPAICRFIDGLTRVHCYARLRQLTSARLILKEIGELSGKLVYRSIVEESELCN
jgi:hypothetical protein